MTLVNLLRALRQRLLDSLESDNREDLVALYTSFTVLKEVSYGSGNKSFIHLLVKLEDAAQDGTMGVKGKHSIPSNEAIEVVCSVKGEQAEPKIV